MYIQPTARTLLHGVRAEDPSGSGTLAAMHGARTSPAVDVTPEERILRAFDLKSKVRAGRSGKLHHAPPTPLRSTYATRTVLQPKWRKASSVHA